MFQNSQNGQLTASVNTLGIPEDEIRRFQAWLEDRQLIYDVASGPARRPTNSVLEAFRNDPTLDRMGRWPRHRPLVAADLRAHLEQRERSTLYAANQQGCDRLLMLADLDNKEGTGQIDAAARYLRDRYLDARCVIEPSTGGRGVHAYFIVNVRFRRRVDVCAIIADYAARLMADPAWETMGVKFDCIIGLPTLWERNAAGVFQISRRGCAMRLPYLVKGLSAFEELRALDLTFFEDKSRRSSASNKYSSPERYLGVTDPEHRPKSVTRGTPVELSTEPWPHSDDPNPTQRRMACVQKMMRIAGGTCTPEQCLDAYMQHYRFTGESSKDERARLSDFRRLIQKVRERYREPQPLNPNWRPFRPDAYLNVVRQVVPETEFEWERGERLDHRRLADFITVKVQDAFLRDPADPLFARTSRKATIKNFRVLKAKDLVKWICTTHQYQRLLDISVRYQVLHIFEDYEPPILGRARAKGKARLIGPGSALREDHDRFLALYRSRPCAGPARVAA
jgi:hypothetical protein